MDDATEKGDPPVTEEAPEDGHDAPAETHDAHEDHLQDTLRTILDESPGVAGVLVATVDGLLVAGEFDVDAAVATHAEAETLSAMAAATVGIGMRLIERLSLGTGAGCVVHGGEGSVAAQRVGGDSVLLLFGRGTAGLLTLAIRRARPRVQEALAATSG